MKSRAMFYRTTAFCVLATCCVALAACGGNSVEVENVYIFTGLSLEEDGCELGVSTLLDGKYVMTPRADGGMTFTYQHGVSTNAGAPPPFACERAGSTLDCWPFGVPNMPRDSYGIYPPWILTAHLTGALSNSDTTVDASVMIYGMCSDGGWDCTAGVEEQNPVLPCRSSLTLSMAMPIPQKPGACPDEGVGSTLGGAPAVLYFTNETGQYFDMATLDENGERASLWSVDQTAVQRPYYTTIGTWFVLGKNYGDDQQCSSGFQINQAEQYIVVTRL